MNGEKMARFGICAVVTAAMSFISTEVGQAAELMSAAHETAVLQKYCGSCHSDALMYGGLSIQHFDAARPDPTLAAMLVSKLTRGHTPKNVATADSAEILKMMQASAMGAAGMGVPDEQTQVALVRALAQQSEGAYDWNPTWDDRASAQDRRFVVSILREKPSIQREGATDSYRLTVTCRPGTGEGEIKVAWADSPAEEGQSMSVAVDGGAAFQYRVEGGRVQGNAFGPGSTILRTALPMQSLTISSLFSAGNLTFPFDNLGPAARRDLSRCFNGEETSH